MGIEARGHTTSCRHAGTTLPRTSSDVIMAVNGSKLETQALRIPFLLKDSALGSPCWSGGCTSLLISVHSAYWILLPLSQLWFQSTFTVSVISLLPIQKYQKVHTDCRARQDLAGTAVFLSHVYIAELFPWQVQVHMTTCSKFNWSQSKSKHSVSQAEF